MDETPAVVVDYHDGSLPLGEARLARPGTIQRIHASDLFLQQRGPNTAAVVPIEAVRPGDEQVLAARETGKIGAPRIDLEILAQIPSVESVVATTPVWTARELPQIRELILLGQITRVPDAATIGNLPGLHSLFASAAPSDVRLALDRLPAESMPPLAV